MCNFILSSCDFIFFVFLEFSFIYFLFYLKIFLNFFLLLFKYSFLPFPPPFPTTPALPISLPCSYLPIVIVHVSFIIVSVNPSPFSTIIPSPLPSGHCQPVLSFNVFGYTLLACLFC